MVQRWWVLACVLAIVCLEPAPARAQTAASKTAASKTPAAKKAAAKKPTPVELEFPPKLPHGERVVTDSSPAFLQPTETLVEGVKIAKTPPTVDFLYFPRQDYEGKPWSNWGDSLAINGKYYASIGDHLSQLTSNGDPERVGNAFVFEYDPEKKTFRELLEVRKLLNLPEGHYVPSKIHGRLDMDDEGWLYCSTHRGSTTVTVDQFHYQGDWILRVRPSDGKAEIVAHGPVPKHCIPNSVLDPKRKIFYGGTAAGERSDSGGVRFFAYDVNQRKTIYDGPDGPARYMIFAKSTGKIYYTPGQEDQVGQLVCFDPAQPGPPTPINAKLGLRSATQETADGMVYTVSRGGRAGEANLFAFNTKTEQVAELGPAHVGSQSYITTIDVDPTGRYLYYIPGAHGGSEKDGSAVVQFDVKTKTRKVIAFLHPFYQEKYGVALSGTFSSAVDPDGSKLYITWNANRGGKVWDCCALTVIHIPESERQVTQAERF
jgi:hypothetical protein